MLQPVVLAIALTLALITKANTTAVLTGFRQFQDGYLLIQSEPLAAYDFLCPQGRNKPVCQLTALWGSPENETNICELAKTQAATQRRWQLSLHCSLDFLFFQTDGIRLIHRFINNHGSRPA